MSTKSRKQSDVDRYPAALAALLNSSPSGSETQPPTLTTLGSLTDRHKSSEESEWAARAVRKALRRSMLSLSCDFAAIASHWRDEAA